MKRIALSLMLLAGLAATDAHAQGHANKRHQAEKEHRKEQTTRQREPGEYRLEQGETARGEWELRRRQDSRWDDRDGEGRRRRVPPGWCKGRGNPHNTPENCGRGGDRYDGRFDRDRRRSSYAVAHDAFHRQSDYRCRARADRRPLDLISRLRVKRECDRAHRAWHERNQPRG